MQVWQLITELDSQMGEKFPLLQALELAKLEEFDLYFAKEYLKAASLGYALGKMDMQENQS